MKHSSLFALVCGALSIIGCAAEEPVTEPAQQAPTAVVTTDHQPGMVDHTVTSLGGETVDLEAFRGRPMLIVNTASECGYTPQYEGLQKLHETYGEQGLVVLGFPSNDFAGQEPGTAEEIADFCRLNYGVTFQMMAKVHTKSEGQAPIYTTLTEETGDGIRGEIRWNFTKFLVDGDGRVVARFEPGVEPMADELTTAIEGLLGDPEGA